MAAGGGARRALLGIRSSSPAAVPRNFSRPAAAAAQPEAAAAFARASRRQSPLAMSRLPAETSLAQSLVLPRTISSSAQERIDYPGAHHGGEHEDFFWEHLPEHLDDSVQPHRSTAGYLREANINQQDANVNMRYGYNPGNPYRSGNAYGQPNSRGDFPNSHQAFSGARTNNGSSGHYVGQTYQDPNGYGTQGKVPINQQSYGGERVINGHYGCNPGQSYQSLSGYNQQGLRMETTIDTHQRPDAFIMEKPADFVPGPQYPNTGGFYKESTVGFPQGHNGSYAHNAGQAYQNSDVHSRANVQNNHQGYSMEVNLKAQQSPHWSYQGKQPDFQSNVSVGHHWNSGSYQSGNNYHPSVTGGPANDQSPSSGSLEASESSKYKGTIDELNDLCKESKVKEALEILASLEEKNIAVGVLHYSKLMQACGDAATVAEARSIHDHLSRAAFNVDIDVNNKILEMYAKCGSMEDAKKLFDSMSQRNITSWDTMILGFANNGLGEEAIDIFTQFKQAGLRPDASMFAHVFLACGVIGSVDEGMLHFESMVKDFGLTPSMEHYVSIVTMLGRSGYVDEALEFVEQMPIEPSIDVWEALMNMCRINGFSELGDRCAEIVERFDPSRLHEQSKLGLLPIKASELAKEKERKKANLLEVRNRVHEYRAGDRSHPEHKKIYEQIKYLAAHMKEAGYIPDTRFVLHDVDQETKEEALLAHSERLAVGYGLITSAARSPIRIIKNLRSCGDCHTAFKIISKLVGRQIIARDAKRFHHFENGVCSCKDYW